MTHTNILLRLTTYPNDRYQYPHVDFKTPLSIDETVITNTFLRLENEYHRFNCNVRNPDLAEEILPYKQRLVEKAPEVFELIEKTIRTWTSNDAIKTKDDIFPYYIKLDLLVDQLVDMLNNEISKQYGIGSDVYNQCQEKILSLTLPK